MLHGSEVEEITHVLLLVIEIIFIYSYVIV